MAKQARAKSGILPLLGRGAELDQLKDAFHEASGGEGHVVLVTGEPGIGKTRLLDELSDHAANCDATVSSASCPDDPGAPPFWPWSQIIQPLVQGMEDEVLVEVFRSSASLAAQAFPSIHAVLGPVVHTASESDTAESARFRLFDSISRLAIERARVGPIVLILDDLHWADEPSLKLLVHLCAEIRRSPILVVGAYRDMVFELGHPVPVAAGALSQLRWCSRIPLRGLAEGDTANLLARSVGNDMAGEMATVVFRATDGNPLFITEIVRLVANDPAAASEPGAFAEGMRDTIARRLSHLSAECRDILILSAILGTEFETRTLGDAVDPESGIDVSAAIDEAMRERIVEESGEGPDGYQFTHELIRDAILSSIKPSRRAALHAHVFRVLEAKWSDSFENHAPKLLTHAVHGSRVLGPEPAAQCAFYAGEAALRAHAFEDAKRHFAEGLSMLRDQPMDDLKASLTFGTVKAKTVLDIGLESRDILQQCFEYFEAKDDVQRMTEVLTYRYPLAEKSFLPLYDRAINRVPKDSVERARLLVSCGIIRALATPAARAGVIELQEALRLARLHSLPWLEMRVLWLIGFAERCRIESSSADRLSYLTQAEALARRMGEASDEIWIRVLIAEVLVHQGRDAEACELADRTAEFADRHGDRLDRLHAMQCVSAMAWHRSDFGTVRELSDMILDLAPRQMIGQGFDLARRCGAEFESGDLVSGRRDLLRLIEMARDVPRVAAIIFLNTADAIVRACRVTGDGSLMAEAAEFVRAFLETSDATEVHEAQAHFILARICTLRDDANGAVAEYQYCSQLVSRIPDGEVPLSLVHEPLAALAASLGKLDDAVRHYEDALRVPGYAMHDHAWLKYDFARVLRLRNSPGDDARSRELLKTSLETAERLGLKALLDRLRESASQTDNTPPSETRDGLTAREMEVLGLIARGLTNKEIGEKLFISAKTVGSHVRNILSKTGTANRTEAATYAIWHDVPGV